MKKFIVDKEFWDLFPSAHIGVLILKNVDEGKTLSKDEENEIKNMLDEANQYAKKYLTSDVISENEVVKVWRDVYSKFPTKKGARCSIENLLKRVLHDNPVGSICPSVDITNSISLKYAFPIGAEDVHKIEGDLHLGIMSGNEAFLPIGSEENDSPLPGEIAYADQVGAVCRCFNWRDGIRTQITDDTTCEFIAMECMQEDRVAELESALNELVEYFTKYLNAEVVGKTIISSSNTEINME